MVQFLINLDEQEEPNTTKNQTPSPKPIPNPSSIELEEFSLDFLPDIPGDFGLPSLGSLSDFESIRDWIDEMQDPEGLGVGLKGEIDDLRENEECPDGKGGRPGAVGVEGSGIGGGGDVKRSDVRCPGPKGYGFEVEGVDGSVGVGFVESLREKGLVGDVMVDEVKIEKVEFCEAEAREVAGEGGGEVLGNLSRLIEKGIGKVSLVGDSRSIAIVESDVGTMAKNDDGGDGSSESESDSSSEASSSSSESVSSSESEDDDGDDQDDEVFKAKETCELQRCANKGEEDMEEGEIVEPDANKALSLHDDDDNDNGDDDEEESMSLGTVQEGIDEYEFDDDVEGDADEIKGPIRSKNESKELPPVPPVTVSLMPFHQMLPVGVVSSIIGAQVILEGKEKHNPLGEGSILWITEARSPLGVIDEIFGPVKNPYYIVRYNSESEVPSRIREGTLISFVQEFADHILNNNNLYGKGYDASGENDEEACDAEFSDDEKEAEYRRMLKMTKQKNNQRPGKKEQSHRKARDRDRPSRVVAASVTRNQTHAGSSQVNQPPNNNGPPAPSVPMQSSNPSVFHGSGQVISSGNVRVSQCPPLAQMPSISSQPHHMHGHNGAVPATSLTPGNQFFPQGFDQGFPSRPPAAMRFPQMAQPAGMIPGATWAPRNQFPPQNGAFSNGIQMNGSPWMQQNTLQALSMLLSSAMQQQLNPGQGFPPATTFPFGMSDSSQLGSSGSMPNQVGLNMPYQVGPNMQNQASPNMPYQAGPNMPNQVSFRMGSQWQLHQPPALGAVSSAPPSIFGQSIPNQALNGTGSQWQPPQSPTLAVASSESPSGPSLDLLAPPGFPHPQNTGASSQFVHGASSSNSNGRWLHGRSGHFRGGRGVYSAVTVLVQVYYCKDDESSVT
ncbi:H/ACA ribonucleoprotein complex non-core subunit NAF1-like protein [Drosera capensis]